MRAHWEVLVYLVASTGAAQAQRCFAYLDLQEIVAAHALVVHVMVGLVGIPAILVLDKGKAGECVRQEHHLEDGRAILQPAAGRSRRGDVAAHEPSKAIAKSQQSEYPQTKPWAARRVFFFLMAPNHCVPRLAGYSPKMTCHHRPLDRGNGKEERGRDRGEGVERINGNARGANEGRRRRGRRRRLAGWIRMGDAARAEGAGDGEVGRGGRTEEGRHSIEDRTRS